MIRKSEDLPEHKAYLRGLRLPRILRVKKGNPRIDFSVRGFFLALNFRKGESQVKKYVFVLFVWFFGVFPAFGQDGEEEKDVELKTTLEEVVVTATKTEEKRKDIANSVIIIDEMDIQESPAQSLGELLANELGLDWRTRGDYGGAAQEVRIRGMNADGTQVLINGMVVNSPSLGSADVGKIPLNNIEKIEVVKGSGSLLYGTSAMGGTINIITKRPKRDKMDLKAHAGYGTEDTYEISAESGMFALGDFGYYLTASKYETDGFRDNADLDHKDVSLKLVYEKGDALDISLFGAYLDRDFGRPGVEPPKGTEAFYVNGVELFNAESASLLNKGSDEDAQLVLDINSNPLEWLGLNLKTSYMNLENYNYFRYYSDYPVIGLPGSKAWVTNEVLQVEGNVNMQPFEGLTLLLGAEYKNYDWENETVSLNENGVQDPSTKSSASEDLHTTGIFVDAQYRPCRFFKAQAGVRHEDHSEFGTEYVPRYGIVINPSMDTALKFNYGEHFNAPTPNDLFWPYEDWGYGSGAQGNPDLKPETGKHLDATIEQAFLEDKVFLTVSYYRWDIDDKIRWASDANYFYRPENLDSYECDGWEIGTKVGPFYDMTLSVGYTYTDAEEELPGGVRRQALYTSDHYLKCDLTYWNEIGFNMKATFRYTGDRPGQYETDTDTNPAAELSSYSTLDLKLEQRLFDHWLFSLQGNNLFDEEYDTYVESFSDPLTYASTMAKYPGAGRSVFFKVTFEY